MRGRRAPPPHASPQKVVHAAHLRIRLPPHPRERRRASRHRHRTATSFPPVRSRCCTRSATPSSTGTAGTRGARAAGRGPTARRSASRTVRNRLLTADDAANETPHAHSGSAVGAVVGVDGNVLLVGALGLGTPARRRGRERALGRGAKTTSPNGSSPTAPSRTVFAELRRPPLRAAGASIAAGRNGLEQLVLVLRGHRRRARRPNRTRPRRLSRSTSSSSTTAGSRSSATGRPVPTSRRGCGDGRHDRRGRDSAPASGSRRSSRSPNLRSLVTAPICSCRTPTAARSSTGYNWGSHYYSLDTTQDEVKDHLRERLRAGHRLGVQLPQARLHVRGRDHGAPQRGPAPGGGVPRGDPAHPGGGRRLRLPARVRRADDPVCRRLRRRAGRTGRRRVLGQRRAGRRPVGRRRPQLDRRLRSTVPG